jgi:hypothetical protein
MAYVSASIPLSSGRGRVTSRLEVVGHDAGPKDGGEMLVFAVACSEARGRKAGVLLYVPTLEQAFEATEEVVREQVQAVGEPGLARAFAAALDDLLDEGPQRYGWWVDVDGYEVWYGPVTADADAADGVAPGELALLASVTTRGSGSALGDGPVHGNEHPSGLVAEQGVGVDGGGDGGDGSGLEGEVSEQPRQRSGLGAQCRLDGPHLRAGRLGVAVHPHRHGGGRVGAGTFTEL